MRYTTPKTKKQLFVIGIATILCFCLIITRLIFLQIFQYQKFEHLGQKNFFRTKTTSSLRGNILDCNGKLLATNKPIINLSWQGTGSHPITKQQQEQFFTISTILQEDNIPIHASLRKIKHIEKFSTSTKIANNIPFETLSKILEQCADSNNISVITDFKRYYPHGSLACHTLGYLGDINMQTTGKMGLERIFEDSLKGQNGIITQVINSFGKKLQQKAVQKSESGDNITTTLDIQLQKIAEKHTPNDHSCAFILMDPKSGALKALVSKPGFDPAIFLNPISSEDWKELVAKKPFVNRAFNACYPPASIFKLVTMSAALENNIIKTDDTFNCKGFIKFKGRKYFCNRHWGHGILNTKESLAYSCNIACYEIAKKISIDTLADYAFRFGLGEKTNIIFPEKVGIVPSNDWKLITQGERWWKGETLSACIGQSFLLTTPIQIACMIAGLFEGFIVKPRILENSEIITKDINISLETRQFLQECMESVITTGTGRRINRLKKITVFAKTGTAQTSSRKKNQKGNRKLCHAWFVSYFYYQDRDPLVMVVLVEKAGGSRAATIVAKQFLNDYIQLIEKEGG